MNEKTMKWYEKNSEDCKNLLELQESDKLNLVELVMEELDIQFDGTTVPIEQLLDHRYIKNATTLCMSFYKMYFQTLVEKKFLEMSVLREKGDT